MTSTSIVVRMVQITQSLLSLTYIPYSAGLLEAHAQKHGSSISRYTFLPIIYERSPLLKQLNELQFVDIVGFSTYIWNIEYSLKLARLLKEKRPEVLIVFGGPQVPDDAEEFLKENPFIDVVCHGAGEHIFLELLEAFPNNNWSETQSISYVKDGQFIHQPRIKKEPLEEIPSPYLNGTFTPLFKKNPKQNWIALWETNRGCPFSCSFCDWGSAVNSKVLRFPMERLQAEIIWFAENKMDMVYNCDANFGIFKRDLEITNQMVLTKNKTAYPKNFYVQNTKNATERAYTIQKTLYTTGLNKFITLSLQSLNPDTLKFIKRENISLDTYRELQHRFRSEGIKTYTDLLIGLPGDDYTSFSEGVSQVIDEGQHHIVKFYQVHLLPNAEMGHPEYRKKYKIETVKTPYFFTYEQAEVQEVAEWQEMVVATLTMDRNDLVLIRAFAWWSEIVYFNRKILQIPLLLLMKRQSLSFKELLEYFLKGNLGSFEILSSIQGFLIQKAQGLIRGEPDYCYGPLAPGIQACMSVEEYIHTGLIQSGAIGKLYQEVNALFAHLTQEWPPHLWNDSLRLSQAIFEDQLPQSQGFKIKVHSNLWDVYQGIIQGKEVDYISQEEEYIKDWVGAPFESVKVIPG